MTELKRQSSALPGWISGGAAALVMLGISVVVASWVIVRFAERLPRLWVRQTE